jgi:hypothetical protein
LYANNSKFSNNDDYQLDILKKQTAHKQMRSHSQIRFKSTQSNPVFFKNKKATFNPNMNIVCKIHTNVTVQLDHSQMAFFYALLDDLNLFLQHLSDDKLHIEYVFDRRKSMYSILNTKLVKADRFDLTACMIFELIEIKLFVNDKRKTVNNSNSSAATPALNESEENLFGNILFDGCFVDVLSIVVMAQICL